MFVYVCKCGHKLRSSYPYREKCPKCGGQLELVEYEILTQTQKS